VILIPLMWRSRHPDRLFSGSETAPHQEYHECGGGSQRLPDLVVLPKNPDQYRRAHNALLAEIDLGIPIGDGSHSTEGLFFIFRANDD
jgi:hypothetical protein